MVLGMFLLAFPVVDPLAAGLDDVDGSLVSGLIIQSLDSALKMLRCVVADVFPLVENRKVSDL